MSVRAVLGPAQRHFDWNRSRQPAVTIAPGDEVTFDLENASDGQVRPGFRPEDLATVEVGRSNPVVGPVFIDGAMPGDVLTVEILDVALSGWGYTAVYPGSGFLVQDLPGPALHLWDYDPAGNRPASFRDGAALVPLDPFCGTIGVAGATNGPLGIAPPRDFGGNLDCRHIRCGATLLLPVQVPGALFSVGDPHAAQGDGEICGTAIESRMAATLRFGLRRDLSLAGAAVAVPRAEPPARWQKGEMVTTAPGPDLLQAARDACRRMIDWLGATRGLSPYDAYMLCSVCADLRISSVGGREIWLAACHFPLAVLGVERD